MNPMKLSRLSGLLLAVALPFVMTGNASASPLSTLTMTLTAPGGTPEVVVLECDPASGSHPNAKRACEELLAADGDFDDLRGNHQMNCTMEYRPVLATAHGVWDGEPLMWEQEFANNCTKLTATGAVFDF